MTDPQTSPLITAMTGVQLGRSLIVMLVVGTILNIINQGDVLIKGASLDVMKLILTYCMPFLVASFGAWSALESEAKSKNKQSRH